ncbi:hydroxymethylbilane synthase [Foetidibacter luteolus]|uniref:hydroxymethylbilane synthase n=1 Tax=Foetidibacter luteolus TaxID=2608880 RepID=UPI00129A7704|nr:hydroxymethylbilane synthase [Foetidibacter luteolus]
MNRILRIGTRDSQLAVWQATLVKEQLAQHGIETELVYIKSEGDIDLVTPLYEIGVQGIFTRTLDAALLSNKIDIAVHSMKDVPTQMARGIVQAAVLKRASYKDLLVYKGEWKVVSGELGIVNGQWPIASNSQAPSFTAHHSPFTIATSSIRRKAQWLHRYPHHSIDNLRGNVNTRLKKVEENNWNGAIFAAAGLERIHLRPQNSIELDWMLPAPAQGAIMVVCREADVEAKEYCDVLHDAATALCVHAERDFLRTLMGGCSTPISALAEIKGNTLTFKGNLFSLDGKTHVEVEMGMDCSGFDTHEKTDIGITAGRQVLADGGEKIVESIRNATR